MPQKNKYYPFLEHCFFFQPFVPIAPFPYPLRKSGNPYVFLMFSASRQRVHWQQMGQSNRGHPLSTYAKFSQKLTFLTSWYAHVRVRMRVLEMLVFRKILHTYLMDGPIQVFRIISASSPTMPKFYEIYKFD